ncbi:MAG: LysR family transcriptional regulator [Proteobacteria bacterium]|jgi:LysR family nitrogen assimilation transcriptional regulator|uniref:LysR family transcriptional regulator n=1 Tax=Piscinibacter sp. TaxID=1903157 RepID=UPI001B61C4F9|nr:LysR substrate-binding domain-containing protein [Piscinibacter sp.]MBP5990978.1 LysR family transcriptional regulator [Piscinibacter sp.]MBP6027573.1 LysR family transcriptional regulator [Piscinibacter sp.]MBS0442753.1 LysR family transcriptional regulator [Pseudomonadota bacterium]
MNLTQLRYFVRVAEMGSFSKAAIELDVAQPALSRQVRLLETDLRVTLLQRTGRGVLLTEAGKRLYDHAVSILQLVAHAREDISANRGEATGRIVIGLPPSMGRMLTLPLVDAFKQHLPRARLAIVEGLSAHIVEWISTGRVDLGLIHNPDANPAIETIHVLDEPLCLVSASKGAARKAAPLPFTELVKLPLVLPEPSHAIRKLLETQAALAGLKLNIAYEVSSVSAILELVRSGHGHAVLAPSAIAASGQATAFRMRPLAESVLRSTLCMAVSAHKPATPLLKQATRLLRELVVSGVGAAGARP